MKVKAGKLKRKAKVVLEKMRNIELCNGLPDLQMLSQDMDTKRNLRKAIDYLKSFIDNIK